MLGLVGGAELLWRRTQKASREGQPVDSRFWQLALLYASGAGLAVSAAYNPNMYVVPIHTFPLVLIALLTLYVWLNRKFPVLEPRIASHTLGVILVSGWCMAALIAYTNVQLPKVPSYGTLEKNFYSHLGTSQNMGSLIEGIHQNVPPGDPIFVFNYNPGIYIFSNHPNATHYQILMSHYNTDAQVREAVAELALKKPGLIIYDQHDVSFFKNDIRAEDLRDVDFTMKPLAGLLQKDYTTVGTNDNFVIFQRKDLLIGR